VPRWRYRLLAYWYRQCGLVPVGKVVAPDLPKIGQRITVRWFERDGNVAITHCRVIRLLRLPRRRIPIYEVWVRSLEQKG
jgi:hypothetical protein